MRTANKESSKSHKISLPNKDTITCLYAKLANIDLDQMSGSVPSALALAGLQAKDLVINELISNSSSTLCPA